MKKTLLLTLAFGLAGASPLIASTVDVYITGATAFRANVYTACTKLYSGGPTAIYYADANHGGANGAGSSTTASWVMTGTPITALTNISGDTLVIHGNFTGSIQGIQSVENSQLLTFAQPHGSAGNNADTYVTNSPTIGFSDASGVVTPYAASGNYVEENVCVQPFVIVKSVVGGPMTNVNNLTWEQFEAAIPTGRLPLSAWTDKVTDTNTFVYIIERTKDSGTRRNETAQEYYQFNDTAGVYIWDATNNVFYSPTNSVPLVNANAGSTSAATNIQVVGTEGPGFNGANLNWGPGYIGGGDIKTELAINNSNNLAIAFLSIADAKGIVSTTGSNWTQVISFNGLWPTAAGAGIHGNTGTNDFSPITSGYYPCWGNEVLVHIIDPSLDPAGDQDITATQLGDQTTPGSFMGVFNAQTLINTNLVSPLVGSIENEIELSKPNGATGIRLSDMRSNRANVGGTIAPF